MSDQTQNIVCPHCDAIDRIPTDMQAPKANAAAFSAV